MRQVNPLDEILMMTVSITAFFFATWFFDAPPVPAMTLVQQLEGLKFSGNPTWQDDPDLETELETELHKERPTLVVPDAANDRISVCDRFGFSVMTEAQCDALSEGWIPPISTGWGCPVYYEVWSYDPRKRPVCAERA
jgi:hypothetical protein